MTRPLRPVGKRPKTMGPFCSLKKQLGLSSSRFRPCCEIVRWKKNPARGSHQIPAVFKKEKKSPSRLLEDPLLEASLVNPLLLSDSDPQLLTGQIQPRTTPFFTAQRS
jgi:hypothetical protein